MAPIFVFSYTALLAALVGFPSVVLAWTSGSPLPARWSPLKIGPDGPWQGVELTFGGDQNVVSYPGGDFFTYVLSTDYCSGPSKCYAEQTGLFNKSRSGSWGGVFFQPSTNFNAQFGGIDIIGDDAVVWADSVTPGDDPVQVPELSMAIIAEGAGTRYPNGAEYQLFAGCLSLGAAGRVNHTFGSTVDLNLTPGYLHRTDQIPSNSFGLHIGSVDPPMPGSLYWGGYDKNRLTGDVLALDGSVGPVPLADISINVVEGDSPFAYRSRTGLLAAGNSSLGSFIPVGIAPCSPYISLPWSTCNAIAEELPLEYNAALGLYTWITDDPQYARIVTSATVLSFTFMQDNTHNVTISVPFMHLNLTLEAPLVPNPTQYFPCHTGANRYALGRAFLQDAFIANNWLARGQPDSGVFFMAQAPGPNIPADNSVVSILPNDRVISTSSNDWLSSWNNVWSPLSDGVNTKSDDSSGGSGNSPSTSSLSPAPSSTSALISPSSSPGLNSGAVAGIAIGSAVAAVGLVVLAYFLFVRRRARKALATVPAEPGMASIAIPGNPYIYNIPPRESGIKLPEAEVDGNSALFELPGSPSATARNALGSTMR